MKENVIEDKEVRVFEEIKKESINEVNNSKPINGQVYGYWAILVSLIGFIFIFLFPLVSIILGFVGLILARTAIKNNSEIIGRTAGIISLIDLLLFIVQVSGLYSSFIKK